MRDWAKHFQEVSERSLLRPEDRFALVHRLATEPSFGSDGDSGGNEQGDGDVLTTGPYFGGDFGGDFGADTNVVKAVQLRLNALGMAQPPLVVDGNTGPLTTAAVRRYQTQKQLTVDGVIGPQVISSLGIKTPSKPISAAPLPTVSGPTITGLKQIVVDSFPAFNGKYEGSALPYMYPDKKGYMTVGTGNMIDIANGHGGSPDPTPTTLSLDWRNPDGSKSSADQITAAWHAVKAAFPGVQSVASQSLTNIRLTKESLDALLFKQLVNNHNYLRTKFPGYVNHPADGQLGINSIAWAYGPGFTGVWGAAGPEFIAAMNHPNGPDYNAAIDILSRATAHEQSINPGLVPRIKATQQLFANAATAIAKNASFDKLYFPGGVVAAGVAAIFTTVLYWFVGGAAVIIGYQIFANPNSKLKVF